MSYKNDSQGEQRAITVSGNTLGLAVDIGYDYGLSDTVFIGISTTIMGGVLNKMKVNEGGTTRTVELNDSQRENLSRISLLASLKIYL